MSATTSSTISAANEMKSQPQRRRVVKTVCSINTSRPKKNFIWDSSNPNNAKKLRAASTEKRPKKSRTASSESKTTSRNPLQENLKKKLRTASKPKTISRNPVDSGRREEILEEPILASPQEIPKKKLRTASKPKTISIKPVDSERLEEILEEPKIASPQVERSPQQKPDAPLVKKTRSTAKVTEMHRETSDAAKSAAVKAAKARQECLPPKTQSVIKSMTPSNVYRVFWMGLPKEFCEPNLLDTKSDIYLEDNKGKEFRVTYLPHKSGLSGGWVSFAREKGLHNCDAVLFQVITRTRLKVHVFRFEEDGRIVEVM